jgi:hypothetical protein
MQPFSNAFKNSVAQHQAQHQHMHKHFQQTWAQQQAREVARIAHHPRQGPAGKATDSSYGSSGASGTALAITAFVMVLAFVALAVLSIVAFANAVGSDPPIVRRTEAGIAVTARTDANLRPGPSKKFDPAGALRAGDTVTGECLQGHWVRLASPNEGLFVSRILVTIDGKLPLCDR